jgi:hypothetical protein
MLFAPTDASWSPLFSARRQVRATQFAAVGVLTFAAFVAADRAARPRVFALAAIGVIGFVVLQLGLARPFGR